MKPADREILSRTEAAAPLNFEIVKLDHIGWGSAYPEGFAIGVSEPPNKFSLPLVCDVTLTSDTKSSVDEPEGNGMRVWLKMTVGTDGNLSYSDFKVKLGPLSPDAVKKATAQTVSTPLVDTDRGKALLFSGLSTKDGQFTVGWTVQAARKGEPPVDWSRWDPTDPDKLLRLYDWQLYGCEDKMTLPYKAVDFVLDAHTGKTAELPTECPNWPWKGDGWQMVANWCFGMDGRRYGLIASGQNDSEVGNFWLVALGETPVQVKDLTTMMRKAVNDLLRERRPEVTAGDFMVSYPIKKGEEAMNKNDLAEVPFVANARSSDQTEFQLSGTVMIRLSDRTVVGAASEEKRLNPFVTNEALRKTDEKLNTIFQSLLKSMPPKDAQAFKQGERDWIAQRDSDASQAVNIMSSGSTQQACEEARENSLLISTKKRIEELERPIR
jgi:uncharacterized protein YecT (DUF1311 family)